MIIVVDLETTGLSPHLGDRPFAFAFHFEDGQQAYYRFPVNPLTREVNYDPEQLKNIKSILSNQENLYVFHNALFDLAMLQSIGISVDGRIADTYIVSHCMKSTRPTHALKPLCDLLLNIPQDDQKDLQDDTIRARREGKKLGWKLAKDVEADYWMADPELCKKYALRDVERTFKLYKYFNKVWGESSNLHGPYTKIKDIIKLNHQLLYPVLGMNTYGVKVNHDKINELSTYYNGKIKESEDKIKELGYAELNPRSSKQKKELFYDQLGFDPIKRRRKKKDGSSETTLSVDKKALSSWADKNELAKALVQLSEAEKQISGFLEPIKALAKDGIIYPTFNICGPATSRKSCSNPNLQNITTENSPNKKSDIDFRLREIFGPRAGHFWAMADYSQIEIICAAYLSKEPKIIKTIEQGESFHDLTAHALFSDKPDFKENYSRYRKLAKTINFAMLYGAGPKKLSEELGILYDEAKEAWSRFWDTYDTLADYNNLLKNCMARNGWITDVFGMPFFLDEKLSYKALNYMIQGTAAGILKRAFLNVYKRLLEPDLKGSRLVLSIHDELIVEAPVAFKPEYVALSMKTAMQSNFHNFLGKKTPFEIETSITNDNWLNKRKIVV